MLLFLPFIAAYIFTLGKDKSSAIKDKNYLGKDKNHIEIKLKGLEGTIFTGFFEIVDSKNKSVEAKIFSIRKTHESYFNSKITPGSKHRFTFNISEPETLMIRIINKFHPQESVKVRLDYSTQFDTFNKEVAQKVIVKPAMATLSDINLMMKDISNRTYESSLSMKSIKSEHENFVNLILLFSFVVTALFALVNYYQIVMFKRFFKQKKLI